MTLHSRAWRSGVASARTGQGGRKQARLRAGQRGRRDSEMMAGGGLGAVNAGSPFGDVQIDLDDPLLRPDEGHEMASGTSSALRRNSFAPAKEKGFSPSASGACSRRAACRHPQDPRALPLPHSSRRRQCGRSGNPRRRSRPLAQDWAKSGRSRPSLIRPRAAEAGIAEHHRRERRIDEPVEQHEGIWQSEHEYAERRGRRIAGISRGRGYRSRQASPPCDDGLNHSGTGVAASGATLRISRQQSAPPFD